MTILRILLLLVTVAAGALAFGQADSRLRPGDSVKVLCEEEPTISAEYRLDRQGYAAINLVGKVNLAGLTEAEAASLIKAEIEAKGLVLRPTVSVKLLQPKDVPILFAGSVEKGGEVAPRPGLRLSDVVALAEPTEAADMKKVRITSRDGKVLIVDYTTPGPQQNPEIRAGDHVFFPLVERALEVYVLGGVKQPGRIAFREGMTIKELLEASGGPLPHANIWRAKLVKPNGEEWPLDLETDGQQVKVEPGDTLNVPLVDRQRFVTVVGAVAKPGLVELQFAMDVRRAVEMAGGLLAEADPNGINVRRVRSKGDRIYLTTPLEPYDIVEVPYSRDKSNAVVQAALRILSILTVFGR